jgi:hypothetical protein
MSPPVVVRACSSAADCALVAKLCGDSFPEECHGQGLSVAEWQQIEAEELSRTPSWWRQIGLACEGDKLLGVVVLTLENEEDGGCSCAGCWCLSGTLCCCSAAAPAAAAAQPLACRLKLPPPHARPLTCASLYRRHLLVRVQPARGVRPHRPVHAL